MQIPQTSAKAASSTLSLPKTSRKHLLPPYNFIPKALIEWHECSYHQKVGVVSWWKSNCACRWNPLPSLNQPHLRLADWSVLISEVAAFQGWICTIDARFGISQWPECRGGRVQIRGDSITVQKQLLFDHQQSLPACQIFWTWGCRTRLLELAANKTLQLALVLAPC